MGYDYFALSHHAFFWQGFGMKPFVAMIFLVVTVLVTSIGGAVAADLDKGFAAAKRGDYETALCEFTPLAEQGDAKAQLNLGVMYDNVQGVLKDYVYAHMWANIAAMNGNERRMAVRDLLEKIMPPAQIAKAKTLARDCVAKNYKTC